MTSVMQNYQSNWPRRSIDKLGLYEADGVRHHFGLDVEMYPRIDPDKVIVTMEAHSFSRDERLTASTRRRQEQEFFDIMSIISAISSLNLNTRMHSHVSWTFPPGTKEPIVSLPLVSLRGSNLPFTEISGVRLQKREDDNALTVTIDLRRNRALAVTLVFQLIGAKLSENVIDEVVLHSNQLIDEFILNPESPLGN